MWVRILSEKLLNRIFISPAWAAASIHLNPFLRILRSFDSGSSCASWQPPCGNSRMVGQIGIGAAVTRRPLPHHRAYGSVHGGSSWLR